jgi:hypothetical protein
MAHPPDESHRAAEDKADFLLLQQVAKGFEQFSIGSQIECQQVIDLIVPNSSRRII